MSTFYTITYSPVPAFHEMSDAEMAKMGLGKAAESVTLYNSKKGTLLSMAHKKVNPILSKFTDRKSMRTTLEKEYQKAYPTMTDLEEFEMTAAGDTRYGFRCTYASGGTKLYSEVISIIEKGHYYTFTASCKFNGRGFATAQLKRLLDSVELN